MTQISARKKITTRILSTITLICFISYDFAWAYPSSARIAPNTLAQRTIFTSDDQPESIARAAAKYLEIMMSKDFRNMPLAGVQEMLEHVRTIASAHLDTDKAKISIEGGAQEGQVFIRISGDHVLRYFNPRMLNLTIPEGFSRAVCEYPINDYLAFQLLKADSGEEAIKRAEAEKKKIIKRKNKQKVHSTGPLVAFIDERVSNGEKVMVLVDGDPGSGKTEVVARAIRENIGSCEVISLDNYINRDRTVGLRRLEKDLWDAHRAGVQVIVFEGVNLQFTLDRLKEIYAGLGGYVYEDMQRSVVGIRTRVENEEDRIEFLRASSYSKAAFNARMSVRQEGRYSLIADYDFIFTRKPEGDGKKHSRRRPPEGSIFEGYKTLLKEFRGMEFTHKEFREKRVASSGETFSDTTARTELDGLVELGILEVDRGEKANVYSLAGIYRRGPPDLMHGVGRLLSELPARPSIGDISAVKGKIDALVAETAIKITAGVVDFYHASKDPYPAISAVLMFWPDRELTQAEKEKIKMLLGKEEQKAYFDKALALIRHDNIGERGKRVMHLGETLHSLAEKVPTLGYPSVKVKGVPGEADLSAKEISAVREAMRSLPYDMGWVGAVYYGYWGYLHNLVNVPKRTQESIITIYERAKERFFSEIPDPVSKKIAKDYKNFMDKIGEGLLGAELGILIFPHYIAALGRKIRDIAEAGDIIPDDIAAGTAESGKQGRKSKVKKYLARAREAFGKGDLSSARDHALQAVRAARNEGTYKEAKKLLGRIDEAYLKLMVRIEDAYFRDRKEISEIAKETGQRRERIRLILKWAAQKMMGALPHAMRSPMLRDGVEEVYMTKLGSFGIICREDKIMEVVGRVAGIKGKLISAAEGKSKLDHSEAIKDAGDLQRWVFANTDYFRADKEGRFYPSEAYIEGFSKSGSVVLVERPDSRIIEVWPQENLSKRPDCFDAECSVKGALATLMGNFESFGGGAFTLEEFHGKRLEDRAGEVMPYTTGRELDALVMLGILDIDHEGTAARYFMTDAARRAPPLRNMVTRMLIREDPDLEAMPEIRGFLDKMEELYGWELLDSISEEIDVEKNDLEIYEQKLMTLYSDPHHVKGEAGHVKHLIGHYFRVANLTEEAAKRCGYSETDIVRFRVASALHDIGKTIATENLGLHYSDKLKRDMTDEEVRILEAHDKDSFVMMKRMGVTLPLEAVFMVALNHEPELMKTVRRLLPEMWRKTAIFATVDQFSAITEPRPYPRDISLDSPQKIKEWLEEKQERGEISRNIKDYLLPVLVKNIPAEKDEDEDIAGTDQLGAFAGFPAGEVSSWLAVPAVVLGVLLLANLRVIFRIFLAKRRLSEYLAETDPKKRADLRVEYRIKEKEVEGEGKRDSIRVVSGIRVFARKGFAAGAGTQTLYAGDRISPAYLPVRILLWLKKKVFRRLNKKRTELRAERDEFFSNPNMKNIRGIVAGILEHSSESKKANFREFEEKLSDVCLAVSELGSLGYEFPEADIGKVLEGTPLKGQAFTLSRALLRAKEGNLRDRQEAANLISGHLRGIVTPINLDRSPAEDLHYIYRILTAIRDFNDDRASAERAKEIWEEQFKADLVAEFTGVRTPAATEAAEPVPQAEEPAHAQEYADERNDILKVFDAVTTDEMLSREPFTSTEFRQARQEEFPAGTAVYMLELLGKMGILCAVQAKDKPTVYQLDDRFTGLPSEKMEMVRDRLFNLSAEIDSAEVAETKTYIESVLWSTKGHGPDPRTYLSSVAVAGFGELTLTGLFLVVPGVMLVLANLWMLSRIVSAKRFLKKYIAETNGAKRAAMEEKEGLKVQKYYADHVVCLFAGVEVKAEGGLIAGINTRFEGFWARLLFFPIISSRGILNVITALIAVPGEQVRIFKSIIKTRKEWRQYLSLPKDDPRRDELEQGIEQGRGRSYRRVFFGHKRQVPGIRVYGWKDVFGRPRTDVRVRDLAMGLRYFPIGLIIWLRQKMADSYNSISNAFADMVNAVDNWVIGIREWRTKRAEEKRFRKRLSKNALFNNAGMEGFLNKMKGDPFIKDFTRKLGKACLGIEDMLKGDETTFSVLPDDYKFPWMVIKLEDGRTLREALKSGKYEDLKKVTNYIYDRLNGIDFDDPDDVLFCEIYHVAVMIKDMDGNREEAPRTKKSRIRRMLKLLLPILFVLLIPFAALAAANLTYTYYSPSGYIETETYVDDWDGDTPLDPSDDVSAGTVDHRLDEAFYDNGTPANPSDDYGRMDRRTHPDGSYEDHEYYTGTDNVHFIRGYDSGGAPVFVYEVINATFAIKTWTNGAGATYHLDSGNQYVNTEKLPDGTVRTCEYDASWNLTEVMIYHTDGRLDREDHTQGIVEEFTPGWQFARGANIPWVRYGYDIGDGVNGEAYEGVSTKRDQLLQDLNRFKGSTVRFFLFCDLRAGVAVDGGGTPTGFNTQANVYADMDALVEAAQVLGVRLIPVLLDYKLADNVNMEGANPVGEYPDLITDNAKRAALVNVLRPFIQRYAGCPEIVMWDIINEPIEITTSTTITVAQVQTFLTDLVNMIHAEDPGTPVTLGTQNRQILLDNWTGLGLDIYQTHYYDYMLPWYPLTDPVTTWGSGLGSIFFGELEPTNESTKLSDIYGSGVAGGGLFWQDDTGFTITDAQASTIRHWYSSADQRPFPPAITSVTASPGNRTFTVNWVPYTGALAGSVDGYTITVGGETFFISGAATSSAVIALPDHLYSGNYDLSIRTEMPDGQRDSDYSPPTTIWAGRSPSETRSGGSCAVAATDMRPNDIFGALIPYALLVFALAMIRFRAGGARRRDDAPGEGDDPGKGKKPASGNLLQGFNTILKEDALKGNTFTREEFRGKRKRDDGKTFSYSTITSEIEGLTELGILNADKGQKPYSYRFNPLLARGPPEIHERIRDILHSLPARPKKEHLDKARKDLDKETALSRAAFSKTYRVPLSGDDAFQAFYDEWSKDLEKFSLFLPNGYLLSLVVREIFTNAYEAIKCKAAGLDEEERATYEGSIQVETDITEGHLQIIIKDNGIGIEGGSKFLLALPGSRERFTEIPESHKGEGRGSGLAVVGMMLARSGGFVSWRRIAKEGGTRVFMTIPLGMLEKDNPKASRRPSPRGSMLEGFNTVLQEETLCGGSFAGKEFRSFREKEKGKLFSTRTVKSELDGMVALGILEIQKPEKRFASIKYTLTERYLRAGKELVQVRKLLETLPARPGEEQLRQVREKLENQVFAEGADVAYYYLRTIPQINLRLIRLASERSTLEKELRSAPDDPAKREQLEDCFRKIQALKAELTLEYELLTPPDYPLERTDGRNYRDEARENIRKAIVLIGLKNESAASSLLSAARGRFAGELYHLYRTEVKVRGPRVWRDVENRMQNVMQGQYKVHGISGGREVLVRERVPHQSEIAWQAIRARDNEIDSMLNELQWVEGMGKRLSAFVDILEERRKRLPPVISGKLLPQPEVSAEELEEIRGLLSEMDEGLANKQVEEKVIAHTAASSALELLKLGEYRGMLEEMMVARGLLRKRYTALLRMIDRVRAVRLTILRENIRVRNSRNIWKLDKILEMFNSGDREKARKWWFGIMRDRDIRNEPEFSRMHAVLGQVKDMFLEEGKEATVRRNIGIMKDRVKFAELLNSFMEDLRDAYVDSRLRGAPESVYDSIFVEKFNQYLAFAKKNNIGRGSPRLIWTFFYLAAYVSMRMPDPAKPSKKIENPLFPAMLDLVRMLEINNIPALAKKFKGMSKKRANLYQVLKDYQNAGYAELDTLSEGEWLRLLQAMAKDASLSAEMRDTFFKAAAVSAGTVALADTSGSQVPWRDMWSECIERVRLEELFVSAADKLRGLIWSSLRPAYWPELFEEEWEEGFVKEISALSSEQLADKFLTYHPESHKVMKDLRRVRDFNKGEAYLNDIYINLLCWLGSKTARRQGKEAIWIIREWIYRHWDDTPKEASYEVIKRSRTPEGPVPIPVDLAVDLISGYYNTEGLLEKNTIMKSTEEGGVFMHSPAFMLRLAAERYLDRTKSVLDLGSGNAFAVSVFAQYARYVKGVEIDRELYEEGRTCVAELSGVVDGEKVDLVNGNFFNEDMSRYDLIYIYWPGYGDADKEKRVWQALNEKLAREMKPGAVFVVLGGAKMPALEGLERLEPLDPAYALSSVYRNAREDSGDPGAEVANVKSLQRLLGIISLIRRQKNIGSARELIENWLRYLGEHGLIATRQEAGNLIMTIKDETFDHVDASEPDEKKARSIMRVARALRRWVIVLESGVKAISFKGTDGVWRIVGFEPDLNEDTVRHEQREIELRKENPSMHWIEAHNQAVDGTGIGTKINAAKMKGSRVERDNEIGSMFGRIFRRSDKTAGTENLGYLKLMDKHGELDAQIQKLRRKKKVVSLSEIEMNKGKDILKDAALFLKGETQDMNVKAVELMDAMQGVSENASAIRHEMDRIQEEIGRLRSATPEEEPSAYSVSRTTIISGEEAYKNMLGYLGSMEAVKSDGGMLDMLAEDTYRMIKCLEQLKVHSRSNALKPDEMQLMKDITVMLWWLFGKRPDGDNAAAIEATRTAVERMLQRAVEGLRGHLENRKVIQAAGFVDSSYVKKMTTILRALKVAEEGPGVSDDLSRRGNLKVLLSLWNGYIKSFAQMRDAEIKRLSDGCKMWEGRHSDILGRRKSYDRGKTALVEKRIFIEEIAKQMGALLSDKEYLAGRRGIFICDTKSPVFVTGQDSHIEIDTGDIYMTKEAFEGLLDVDPGKKTALAARLFQLMGERKTLLEKAVERCNTEIEFAHNKLRALRVELGNAANDQAKVQAAADKIRELSSELIEMEDAENRINSGDDPAKILGWIRKKLNDPREWARSMGYRDWNDNYVEFIPNVKLLEQLLETHKEVLEAEIGFVEKVYHPSVYREGLLDGLKAERESVGAVLREKAVVIDHIHDVNIGSMTSIFGSAGVARRRETTKESYAVIAGGSALPNAWWAGLIVSIPLVLLAGYRICRWLYLKGKFKGLTEKRPRLGRLLFRIFGITYEKAVSVIDQHYEKGKKKGTLTPAKAVEQYGGIFIDSSTRELDVIARLLLTGKEKVLDLGSGNAKAVAIFSQRARHVKGIEIDEELSEEGTRCIADLAGVVDPSKVELENGDFLDEKYEKDLAEADLVYIYWPSYNVSVGARVMAKLEEKLVRLLKPGAMFVVNNSGPVGDFERLEKAELPFDLPYGLVVYRNDPSAAAWRAIEDERESEEWVKAIRNSGHTMTLEDWGEVQRFREALAALSGKKNELIEKYGKLPGMGFKVEGGLGAICVDCAEKYAPEVLNQYGFDAHVVHRQFYGNYREKNNCPPIHAYNIVEVCGEHFIVDIDADPFEGKNTGVVVIPLSESAGTIYTEGFVATRYHADKRGHIVEYSSYYVQPDGSTVKYLWGNRVEYLGKGKDIKDPDRKIRVVRFCGGAEMIIGYQGTRSGDHADMSAVIMVRSSSKKDAPSYNLKIDNIRSVVTDAKEGKGGIVGGTEVSVRLNDGNELKIFITGEGTLGESEHVSFEGKEESIADALLVGPARGEDGSMRFTLPRMARDRFDELEEAVEAGNMEKAIALVEKMNGDDDMKAVVLKGETVMDAEHLDPPFEKVIALRDEIGGILGNMGVTAGDAWDVREAFAEASMNILEHSRENAGERDKDVFGVAAVRMRREDDHVDIEIFARDNGGGCELMQLLADLKKVRAENIFKKDGRGIFISACCLRDTGDESITIVSNGKKLVFKGGRDYDDIPLGVVVPHEARSDGFRFLMKIRRPVKEEEDDSVETASRETDKVSAQEKAIEDHVALRMVEDRLRKAFSEKKNIGWVYKGKRVSATVEYDDFFENFAVFPEENYRAEHPELDILDEPAAQTFIAPQGSFGQIEVRFRIINGEPAILFDEVHPSRGYRKLNGKQVRSGYRLWAENAIREIVNIVREFGIQAVYASRSERIKRRYDRQRVPVLAANLWENYEFPFKDKGWVPVKIDNSREELPVESEDQGGMLLWGLDPSSYSFDAADTDVADDIPVMDVMAQMGTVVPEMVNGLMTAGYGEKVVIAIDEELGAGWTRKQLCKVMSGLRHLSGRDDQLGRFLQNVVIRHGKGEILSRNLDALVEKGDVKKENIVIITSEANLREHFSRFDGVSTITGIDDKELTDDFYYPLVEIVLFTLARTLRYDRNDLVRCYRNIANSLDLDDDAVWEMCWDDATKSYKTTMVIRLIPGAVKLPGDRGLYHQIRQYIASRA